MPKHLTFLLLIFSVATSAWAAEVEFLNLPKATPVYAAAKEGSAILVMAAEGEKVAVRQRGARYTRIQVKRNGKWKVGYVFSADLEKTEVVAARGDFGFGGGGMYSYLRHSGKTFETDDQVRYSTHDFTGGSFSPFLTAQYGILDFWRFNFAYRRTNYSSTAATDVPGAAPRKLTLEHTMLSFTLQKLWTPFAKPNFYYGAGIEASHAIAANLVLGGNKLPLASKDMPTYLGGQAVAGGQFEMSRSFTAYAEVRALGYFNQSPIIMGAEVAFGLLYWP